MGQEERPPALPHPQAPSPLRLSPPPSSPAAAPPSPPPWSHSLPKTNGSSFLPIHHCSRAHPLAAAPPSCPQPHRPCSGTGSIDQRPICRLSHLGSPDSGRQSCCWLGQPEAKGEMKLPHPPGRGAKARAQRGRWLEAQSQPSPARGCYSASTRAKQKVSP